MGSSKSIRVIDYEIWTNSIAYGVIKINKFSEKNHNFEKKKKKKGSKWSLHHTYTANLKR